MPIASRYEVLLFSNFQRASQIRSAPFSGDSSDSSDGEEMGSGSGGSGPSHPISSGETDISSPGKSAASSIATSLSPLHRSSSPSKSLRRGTQKYVNVLKYIQHV